MIAFVECWGFGFFVWVLFRVFVWRIYLDVMFGSIDKRDNRHVDPFRGGGELVGWWIRWRSLKNNSLDQHSTRYVYLLSGAGLLLCVLV